MSTRTEEITWANEFADSSNLRLRSWLVDGDPSIAWQALADLFHAPPERVRQERSRIATEGWGAQLLAEQSDDGSWGEGLYSPKWTSTTYTLLQLERMGLEHSNPQAQKAARLLWDSVGFYDGGLNFAKTIHEPETCVTALLIYLAGSFGIDDPRLDRVVEWLLGQQLDDGGWNCESIRSGSVHGSFHTSILALEALDAYRGTAGAADVSGPIWKGHEFFLDHQLYRSHRGGQVVDSSFTRFPFPPHWHFDIVRGLEHFRASGADRDPRLVAAVEEIAAKRRSDGTWPMYRPYPGRQWFRMESRGPSRWSTLRALRVLNWWAGSDGDRTLRRSRQFEGGS